MGEYEGRVEDFGKNKEKCLIIIQGKDPVRAG